jgi:class 3 adenylate cyclase/ABC-type transport system involved in cytochrome c biogenesis ATPase subunit/tetratricopeptide (TPR) repeat protein
MGVDVRTWLHEHGFDRYAGLFEQHEIDGEALAALTDDNLKELGLPLGPRVKLLKAIAALAAGTAPLPAPVPAVPAPPAAERRQLTVVFVDLVGSTALSSRLDPEDLRAVVRAYQKSVAAEVERYGGHIAQYLGDGVLAYFGYPVAHEDEAERAVHASRALLASVAATRAPGGEALAARVGIATGLTVVGDLLGEGAVREHAVVGETPNLAARLQGLAAPGQVVVSTRTAQLVRTLFELEDLGPQSLKGLPSAQRAYAVLGERQVESRFDARTPGQLGEMVGRDAELALLLERWRRACAGEGQLVVLNGDAGIGKSRIVRALQQALVREPHVRINYQCSPYHADSALYPVIRQLRRAAGIAPADGAAANLDRLEALLGDAQTVGTETLALMAGLLGIDAAARYPAPGLAPQQQRQRILESLVQQPALLSQAQPVLIVLEDAHWIDPSTLELMQLSVERLARSRVLILVTARPEFTQDFGRRHEVTRVPLSRLGRAQIAALSRRVAHGKALPEELVREIAAKTDGVPLFVEEITRTLLESGRLREIEDAFVIDGPLQSLAVPDSLSDSFLARLDRLQPVKIVAQTAACIGREFDYALLAAILPLPESELQEALQKLTDAEIVFRRGTPPQASYSFKHALLRDAAYECLLKSSRQRIHAQLVAALEACADTAPEVLAHHAAQAGLAEKAIEAWQKAAAQALARPAYKEALSHLRQAAALAGQMGGEPAWLARRLQLLLTLGQAAIPFHGYGHSETVAAFSAARDVAARIPGTPHRFSISYAVWGAQYIRGEHDQALATARGMLEEAHASGNPGHQLSALRSLAISQMISGAPLAARDDFAQAARLSASLGGRSSDQRAAVTQRFAADPEISTQFHVALTLWALGEVAEGRRIAADALAAARASGHAHTLAHALAHAAIVAVVCRDVAQARALSDETIGLTRKYELAMFEGYGSLLKAYALALDGDTAESAERMDAAFDYMARSETGCMLAVHRAVQARSLASLGRLAEAERHAAWVREALRTGSERYFWPECERLLGDYLALRSDTGAARAAYQRALASARSQQAASWARYAEESLQTLPG